MNPPIASQDSSSQKPLVLLVNEYGVLNGGENSMLSALQGLHSTWLFAALVPGGSPLETELSRLRICNEGLELRDPDGVRHPQATLREILKQQILNIKPALIHCNSLAMARLLGPVANQIGVPSLGYLRDILKLSKTAIRDLNECSRLIAVSQAVRDFHVQQGVDANRVTVIYNGVDRDDLLRRSEFVNDQTEPPLPGGEGPIVLFVGQLGMRKGIDTLIRVFEQLVAQIPNARLWVVGERNSQKLEARELEDRLKNHVQKSDYRDRVHWLGRRGDVARLMQRATILLHPARQEPLGRVLLEAASLGLPIVSTRVGGTPEILSTEIANSMIGDAEDVTTLAGLCQQLLENGPVRQQYQQELSQIAARFRPETCSSGIAQVYKELLESSRNDGSDRVGG